MLLMTLKRGKPLIDYTPGILTVLHHQLYTVEDVTREIHGKPVSEWKKPGQTAIPRGNYKVIVNESARFKKRLPLLLDVPGFEGVRIHSGNTARDTEGCILPGLVRTNEGIARSRDAMALLMPLIEETLHKGEEVWLLIS